MKKTLVVKLDKVMFRKKWKIPPAERVIVDKKRKLAGCRRRDARIKLRRISSASADAGDI